MLQTIKDKIYFFFNREFDGVTFNKKDINLDEFKYKNCVFNECSLIYKGSDNLFFQDNTLNTCRWEFIGAAGNTLDVLKKLNNDCPELIADTFGYSLINNKQNIMKPVGLMH